MFGHHHGNSRRRVRSRRAVLSRVTQLIFILALLCLGFGLVFGLAALLSPPSAKPKQFQLSLIYVGTGALLLLLRWVVLFFHRRHAHRRGHYRHVSPAPRRKKRRRRPAARTSAAPEPLPQRAGSGDRAGSVLVLTLVVLGLIAALLAQVQFRAQAARRTAETQLRIEQLTLAAEDAVRHAMRLLHQEGGDAADHTNSPWAAAHEFETPDGISTRVRITDTQRYFDLNNCTAGRDREGMRPGAAILADIFTLCGDFTPLARLDALMDWIDEDDEGFRETAFYREKDPAYTAPNRPLYTLHEVLSVDGFHEDLFRPHTRLGPSEPFSADLLDCVCVLPFPRSAPVPINVNTASREVLLGVLGLEHEEAVRELLGMRHLAPIVSMDTVAAVVDADTLTRAQPYLDVQSRYFRIHARSFKDGRGADVNALVQRGNNGRLEILQWTL